MSFLVQLSYISIQKKTPHYYFINLENQMNTLNSNPLLYLVLSLNNISCSYIFCFLFYLRFSFAEFILKNIKKCFNNFLFSLYSLKTDKKTPYINQNPSPWIPKKPSLFPASSFQINQLQTIIKTLLYMPIWFETKLS